MAKAGYVGNQPVRESQAESYPGAWTGQEQYQEIKGDNWPKSVYEIERSIRLNSADSAFFSRTPASAGNRKTWTWAGWVKRSGSGVAQAIFGEWDSGASNGLTAWFQANDTLVIQDYGPGVNLQLTTTQVFRDFSAWFHLLVAVDTTQATASNRVKVYVNGTQVTTFSAETYPTQNLDTQFNRAQATGIGRSGAYSAGYYFNGYLANIHFIDGQALTPSAFATTDPDTNQWVPKKYTNSYGYGTNGFWLKFADNSAATATTLGKDYSGNSNNWTPNNLSVTAGAGNDSLVDTPTSYGTDDGLGGSVRGNYATLNPLQNTGNTLSNGNLDVSIASTNWTGSTVAMTTGKWYTEFTVGSTGTIQMFGVCNADFYGTGGNAPWITAGAKEVTYYVSDGRVYVNGVNTGATSGATAGDIISFAFDADARSVAIRKNNTLLTTKTITASAAGYIFYVSSGGGSCTATLNYGARSFAYTAPSGFKALCDTNLPAPTIANPSTVMDVKLYIGNGSTQTISGLGFSPDLVWIKCRSASVYHALFDAVRGVHKRLGSNETSAEQDQSPSGLSAFTSDGFTVVDGASGGNGINGSPGGLYAGAGAQYAAWAWDAGSSTVTNTQGSITSSVRANASAGISILTFTGPISGASTAGHGLNTAPEFLIVRPRGGGQWFVYHKSLPANAYILMNTTAAYVIDATKWNGQRPTSAVINLGTTFANAGNCVCYAFSPVTGYSSSFGYQGNGSADGPYIQLGFRPRLILLKNPTAVGDWTLLDTTRAGYNVDNNPLYPNLGNAEGTTDLLDITSNGFKLRTTDASVNGSLNEYIGFAWAESPFQYARAR